MVLRGAQNTFGCRRRVVSRHAASNKSLDVRRKQRLCYQQVFLTQTGLVAVSAHVTSAVIPLPRAWTWKKANAEGNTLLISGSY